MLKLLRQNLEAADVQEGAGGEGAEHQQRHGVDRRRDEVANEHAQRGQQSPEQGDDAEGPALKAVRRSPHRVHLHAKGQRHKALVDCHAAEQDPEVGAGLGHPHKQGLQAGVELAGNEEHQHRHEAINPVHEAGWRGLGSLHLNLTAARLYGSRLGRMVAFMRGTHNRIPGALAATEGPDVGRRDLLQEQRHEEPHDNEVEVERVVHGNLPLRLHGLGDDVHHAQRKHEASGEAVAQGEQHREGVGVHHARHPKRCDRRDDRDNEEGDGPHGRHPGLHAIVLPSMVMRVVRVARRRHSCALQRAGGIHLAGSNERQCLAEVLHG
mmetsp:Transcript_33125/g.84631  ORF Transcript_33125/g.84631 Transcript_33125/m.84631 type:complete len:324 (-) Transcript_33125:421-1392(-)